MWLCVCLCVSVYQRAEEDVLQKEVRVKILKDNINVLVSQTPPAGEDLSVQLGTVLHNYHKLCERFKSKCHTLEVQRNCVCVCVSVCLND